MQTSLRELELVLELDELQVELVVLFDELGIVGLVRLNTRRHVAIERIVNTRRLAVVVVAEACVCVALGVAQVELGSLQTLGGVNEVVEELLDERQRLDAQRLPIAELVEPLAQVHILVLGYGR